MDVLNTGVGSAEFNMQLDEELLEKLNPEGDPILHLYDWETPSATFGYFIKPEMHLDLEKAKKWNLSLARRSTGGGIVFHIWDLAFSFLMPSGHKKFSLNTLENYQFVNGAVLNVMKEFFKVEMELIPTDGEERGAGCRNFCMALPTVYDVVYKGMKIAGAAQRKRKQGYLHQGTISLAFPKVELLEDVLLERGEVVEAMKAYTFAAVKPEELGHARKEIQNRLAENLREKLAGGSEKASLT